MEFFFLHDFRNKLQKAGKQNVKNSQIGQNKNGK